MVLLRRLVRKIQFVMANIKNSLRIEPLNVSRNLKQKFYLQIQQPIFWLWSEPIRNISRMILKSMSSAKGCFRLFTVTNLVLNPLRVNVSTCHYGIFKAKPMSNIFDMVIGLARPMSYVFCHCEYVVKNILGFFFSK